ncbi:hypothetical protein GCM10010358_49360 [Streptomyces minutiscleroticus]|uniref:Uncharacterized protein n=1 Tax=Streptomyces minutiscleroticus TaxID=68238 RepID=A0A918U438_9ACTN|nr:TspO/MBR family protein [Streptomyces minutiscleroticus]GGX89543.1 hypothetical protein GCM10010358_49360 [Streptomyces minutiscleroticus]
MRFPKRTPAGRRRRAPAGGRLASDAAASVAVTAAAVLGARAVDADSAWYHSLEKPPWQPPSWAFGAVWTRLVRVRRPGGRARPVGRPRAGAARAVRGPGRRPGAEHGVEPAVPRPPQPARRRRGHLLLDAGNAELIRRTARTDGAAAPGLVPYALRCGFATALNTSIARRNR